MPEGPSIVILREELSVFVGKKIIDISGNSKIDLQRMKGKKIKDMRSWGKHFLICFDDFFIRIHLLMFGSYRINERKELPPRLSFKFAKGEFNFYSCAVKMHEGNPEEIYDWSSDTMSDEWDPEKAYKTIRSQKDVMICDSLMDQEVFAGVGNIIKNEVLFITKVHPEALNGSIPAKKKKEVVKVAREFCFDFLRWKKIYQLKKHYQIYTKKKCPRCESAIIKKPTGVRKRRSFFCETCQKKYDSSI